MSSWLRFWCALNAGCAVTLQTLLLFGDKPRDYTRISVLGVAAGVWTCGYILARWLPRGPLGISVPVGTIANTTAAVSERTTDT